MPSNKTLFMDGPIADKQNEGVNEKGMIWVVGFSVIIYILFLYYELWCQVHDKQENFYNLYLL